MQHVDDGVFLRRVEHVVGESRQLSYYSYYIGRELSELPYLACFTTLPLQGLVGTGSAKYQDNSAAELRNDRVPVGSLAGGRLVVPLEPRPPVHSKRGPLRSPAAQPLVRPQSLMVNDAS